MPTSREHSGKVAQHITVDNPSDVMFCHESFTKAYGDNNCYGEDKQGKDAERCIALIDYENCSNLKNISLKEYAELIIFTGTPAAKCCTTS